MWFLLLKDLTTRAVGPSAMSLHLQKAFQCLSLFPSCLTGASKQALRVGQGNRLPISTEEKLSFQGTTWPGSISGEPGVEIRFSGFMPSVLPTIPY